MGHKRKNWENTKKDRNMGLKRQGKKDKRDNPTKYTKGTSTIGQRRPRIFQKQLEFSLLFMRIGN